jgi:SAM-dependent methyltransferase
LSWAEEDSVKNPGVFDNDLAQGFRKARQVFIEDLLGRVQPRMKLESALDVGCGIGYFSKFLFDRGFRVIAVDGREENAMEGRKRYPEITFLVKDVESPELIRVGTFDFVLCVGLLYHLENPFRAIRNLHSLTNQLLLIESMCAPGDDPSLKLVDESRDENQGLNYVAFYPTEACLVKMLYRAGFPFVYTFETLPRHPLFDASLWKRRERTMLLATKNQLTVAGLKLARNVRGSWEILASPRERVRARLYRLAGSVRRFRAQHSSSPPDAEEV